MKRNLVPLIVIAFVVAIVSTFLFYTLFLGKLRNAGSSPGQSIVVAARNLDRGAALKPEDLKLAPWSSPTLPQGAISTFDEVKGMTLIASVQQGEAILKARVATLDSGAGAGLGIKGGMRAISIHATDSSGIVNILRPGHKVDVQLVTSQGSQPELRTILQNIEVLAVNPTGEQRNPSPVITLLVNPQGADMAGLGDSGARLRLVLRNPLDDGATTLDRVTIPGILGAKK